MIVIPGDEASSQWVADRLGETGWTTPHTSLAVLKDDGRLVCCVVYAEYKKGADIKTSIATAGPGWATKGVLRALFHYPFHQLDLPRITALVAESNTKSRRMVEKMGFEAEGYHPKAWDGIEAIVSYGMLRENCKWI